MRVKLSKYSLLLSALCLFLVQFFINSLLAQGTSRPKVLVLPPKTELDKKVVEAFQWDLANALDKSGNFDIVSKEDYGNYLKEMKMSRVLYIPDSLIPEIMDSLGASIHTVGTLSQEGGEGTTVKAKIDFIFPKNDYTLPGEEFSVENETRTEDLANQVAQTIILASEKISRMSIARSYYNSAIYDKAIENYEKLLELEPGDVDIYYMIATSYLKMDSIETAIAKYEKILDELDPNNIPTREILAKTYFAQEKFEDALRHYKSLSEEKPDEYAYVQYLAYSLNKLERQDEALEAYLRLVEIEDQDSDIRMQIGWMYYTKADELEKAGDTEGTKSNANEAVRHFANFTRILSLQFVQNFVVMIIFIG